MQALTDFDGTLVLTHDSAWLSKLLFGLAALLIATGGYDYFVGVRGTDRLIAILGGVATCALGGLVTLERAHFRLSPRAGTIVWSRRWGFRRRSGSLSFEDVKSIVAERPLGDDGIPSRRIVLHTRDGRTIPVTVGYSQDGGGDMLRIAEQIGLMVGSGGGKPSDALQSLIDAGQIIDAVKLLRETRGLTITEAKAEIEAMKKQS